MGVTNPLQNSLDLPITQPTFSFVLKFSCQATKTLSSTGEVYPRISMPVDPRLQTFGQRQSEGHNPLRAATGFQCHWTVQIH